MEQTKIAILTAGSRGLGKNTALRIAKNETDLVITYHNNKQMADQVVVEIQQLVRKATAIQLDASNTNGFPAFVVKLIAYSKNIRQTPSSDYLINNARPVRRYSRLNATEEESVAFV